MYKPIYFRGTRDKHKHNLGNMRLEFYCLLEASKLKRIMALHFYTMDIIQMYVYLIKCAIQEIMILIAPFKCLAGVFSG